jgi:hypothetical protein
VLKDVSRVESGRLVERLTADTSSVLTALWARGLREFAELAAWLEERSSQRWAEGLYARAQAGFEVFWDEARGSYIDHIVDGAPQPEMSQLAGALAICRGAGAGSALAAHHRPHHRPGARRCALVDGRRRRVRRGKDAAAVHGHL